MLRNMTAYRHDMKFVMNMLERHPEYAAPEQIHFQNVDYRTDLYCLGILAYQLLCGHPPFRGKSTDDICLLILVPLI